MRIRRRVPVRMQLNNLECGAACLAMVLSYHGRRTSVAQCRESCDGGRGGIDAATIARSGRAEGLVVTGYAGRPEVLDDSRLPAIAHWEHNHFVVVERRHRRGYDIVDPGWGRRRLTTAEFEEGLSDAVLVMRPGPDFAARTSEERSPAWVLAGEMLRVPGIRSVLGQILLVTLLLQVFGLTLPVATALVVDEVFGTNRPDLVAVLGGALLVAVVAQLSTSYLRSLLILYLQGRLDVQLLARFADHLYRLPLRYFHQRTTGDITMRMASLGAVRDLMANQSLAATLDAVLVITYVALMFVFSPPLAAVVLVVLAVQATVFLSVTGRARDLMARNVAAQVRVQEYLVQTVSGISTVKATGAEPHVVRSMNERILQWTATTLRRDQFASVLQNVSGALQAFTPLVVLWSGTWLVLDGQLSVGTLLGFTWLASAVLGPLMTLMSNWQRFQAAGVQLERLGDVLQAEPEPRGGLLPSAGEGAELELRAVQFRYDRHDQPAVRSVDLLIEAGSRVAIVGSSGAGKTTLAMLLLGLYTPTAGQVHLDGVPLTDLDLRAMRARMGAVLQDPFTVRGSIRENITLAHPDATDEDVLRAARVAEVDGEVGMLPQGYETELAEHGVGLSGGQLQRLALARALVGRPSVLVLDEATSHLDGETEQRIVRNLRTLACTQIVIAHRLSTVEDADLILVMDGGRIVERGTHEALVRAGGRYAQLVAAQMFSAPEGPAPPPADGPIETVSPMPHP
jgi:ATP-binding cassette, subfamily B, bacterial